LAVVGITMTLFAIDATKTPWSPARQNLAALVGRDGCGLANQLTRDPSFAGYLARSNTATLVHPAVGVYLPCASIPRITGGLAEMPDVVVFQKNWPLLIRPDPFAAVTDLYKLRHVDQRPPEIADVRLVRKVIPRRVRIDAVRVDGQRS
jgi:hypothetical protein